jgi:hypothetical protein
VASPAGFDGAGHTRASHAPNWKRASTLAAAVGVALLPKCPACWSVYASLSSLLGVSFVLDTELLKALTLGSLALALISLASMARTRKLYAPLATAVVSAAGVWIGRFELNSELCTNLSLFALIVAALAARWWGARARRASELAQHAEAR